MLNRRQILLGVTALMGSSLSPSSAAILEMALHTGQQSKDHNLSANQLQAITIISDIIIPETETAGAVAAGAPAFVAHALTHLLLEDEAKDILDGLDGFLKSNSGFLSDARSAQFAAMEAIDNGLDALPAHLAFYRPLKELILVGYYTSEVGATIELAYDPVPGGYAPLTVTANTKSWST